MPDQPNDAVIALLQSMDSKIDRNFDQLHEGQVKMFDLYNAHVSDDHRQFAEIKEAVDVARGAKESDDEHAKRSADLKLLGATAIGGGSFIFELLRYLRVIK